MIVLYLLFVIFVAVYGIKFKDNDDFLSKDRCNSIKGIFILLVFFRHAVQYMSDYPFSGIDCVVPPSKKLMGHLIVVMFLFYSGYGVAVGLQFIFASLAITSDIAYFYKYLQFK